MNSGVRQDNNLKFRPSLAPSFLNERANAQVGPCGEGRGRIFSGDGGTEADQFMSAGTANFFASHFEIMQNALDAGDLVPILAYDFDFLPEAMQFEMAM